MKFFFDPGGACAGWACFSDEGVLLSCGLSRPHKDVKDPNGRARYHKAFLASLGASTDILSESMWFRPRKGKKGQFIPPQDLIDTNLIAGHVGTNWVIPHTWKGMVPKDEHQPKILACLAKPERALVDAVMPNGLRHNCIDAVGIGLWRFNRLSVESEACKEVKQLIKRTRKRSAKASGSASSRRTGSGTNYPSARRKSGSKSKKPSFVVLPKGGIRMPTSTAAE